MNEVLPALYGGHKWYFGARVLRAVKLAAVMIVGAGIGGLSAAISLRKADWNVRVFTGAAAMREARLRIGGRPERDGAVREPGRG